MDAEDAVQTTGRDAARAAPGARTPAEAPPADPRPHRPPDRLGLSSQDAATRLDRYGPNQVTTRRRTRLVGRVLGQLRDPLTVVLLIAAALTVVTGDHADAVIITVVVVVNTVVGVAQEIRADHAVAALCALTAPTARVIRDGAARIVPARELVPGDVVELGEGDIVPADARLIEAAAVLVDESALTGECLPVDKTVGDAADGVLQAGTVVVRGRAVAVVTTTGAGSAMGRIAALMDAPPTLTPLQRRLVGLGRWLAGLTVALCLVVMTLGLVRGQPVELMVVTAISLAVAAVPESLPAVVTLALALGARRMAGRHAIVRRLPAVETLGSVTMIATDKTGTLTEGDMVVEGLWTPSGEATVTGHGYAPEGQVCTPAGPLPLLAPSPGHEPRQDNRAESRLRADLLALLRGAALCCDARLVAPGGTEPEWTVLGDPTEAALLAAAVKVGVHRESLDADLPRFGELPFDSVRRRMTTVHRRADGGVQVVCKGAPDVLLHAPLVRADPALINAASERAARYAAGGYRVLAVASGVLRPSPDAVRPQEWERDLTLLGLIAISDPPRSAAASTLSACRAAGITPVLITGDHVATARSIATRVGLATEDDPIVVGNDLAALGDVDPTSVRVFARTSPEQKLEIIQVWQSRGHVVAMTGDGVNDGPALSRADIGVAMGRRGTEVARQAADLVLADDDLATVVAAVEEGRRVYANVRRFLLYALSGGVAEIMVMLLGPALGMALPLLPAQILWINLITHGMPGVAFGAEPATADAMQRAPRPPAASVLGEGLWQRIGRNALVITLVTLGTALWVRAQGGPWQSMAFLTLATAQLAVALAVRARPASLTNPALLLAVVAAFGAQLAGVYLAPLQDLLGTQPLSPAELTLALLACLPGYLLARLDRHRTDRRHAATTPPGGPAEPAGSPLPPRAEATGQNPAAALGPRSP